MAETGGPDPGEPEPGAAPEVDLHVQIPEMSARGGTRPSRRKPTLYVNVGRAQMKSVSSAVAGEPCDAQGTWTGLGLLCCPPGFAPLTNPRLLEIFLVTMETSLRENPD